MLTLPLFVALSVSGDISKIGKYDCVYCMYRNIFDEIWNTDMVIEYMTSSNHDGSMFELTFVDNERPSCT